jgi:hypothetical protein
MRLIRPAALLLCLLCASASAAAAQAVSKCFHAEALQGGRTVTLRLDGAKVSGTFTTEGADGAAEGAYNFVGTRKGDRLAVTFEKGVQFGSYKDATVVGVDDKLGKVVVKVDGQDEEKTLDFGQVLKS